MSSSLSAEITRDSSSTAAWWLVPFFTKRHQEALNVEIQLLGMILQKNLSSHQRTRYYRRAHSAWRYYHSHLAAVSSSSLFIDFEPWIQNTIPQLERDIRGEQEQIQRQQKRKAILWEVVRPPSSSNVPKTSTSTSTSTTALTDDGVSTTSDIDVRIETWLAQCQEHWSTVLSQRLPTCLQKIQAAGVLCFDEMARGFFLPFHSILVGCLSRIHVLLFRYRFYMATELLRQVSLICDGKDTEQPTTTTKKKDSYSFLYARMSSGQKQILTTLQQDVETIVQSLKNTSQQLQTKPFYSSSSSSSPSRSSVRTTTVLQSLGLRDMKQLKCVNRHADEDEERITEDTNPSVLAPHSPIVQELDDSIARDSPMEQRPTPKPTTDEGSNPLVQPNADVGESIGRIDDVVAGTSWHHEPQASLPLAVKTDDAHDVVLQKLSSSKQKSSFPKLKRKQPSDQQESTTKRKKNPKKKRKAANDFFDQLFG